MSTTKARKIINAVNTLHNNDEKVTVFNDKLVDGARSIKVWGWSTLQFMDAIKALEAAGLTVKVAKGHRRPGVSLTGIVRTLRLHVK